MKRLACTMMFWPLLAIAQGTPGISFEQSLDWQQVLAKAKSEHKYVFLSAQGTPCSWCKIMDDTVFASEKVGTFMNSRFISVRIQMDKTKEDSEANKQWHVAADSLTKEYKITRFPTYLFFSPEGKAVHRGFAERSILDFITLASDAINPDRQYYTALDKYRRGEKDYPSMPWLIKAAQDSGERELPLEIAEDYIHGFLDKLGDDEFCTRANIEFLGGFPQLIGSRDRAFDFYYRRSVQVDAAMGHVGYGHAHVDAIITAEEIAPLEERAEQHKVDVDWADLTETIQKKYNADYGRRNVLTAQVYWYLHHEQTWPGKSTKYLLRWLDKNGLPGGFSNLVVGNALESVVLRFDDNRDDLNKAIHWMEMLMNDFKETQDTLTTGWVDPYAVLLYKVGRVNEAIAWQGIDVQLLSMAGDSVATEKRKTVLKQMQNGEKTGQLWRGKVGIYDE